MKQGPDLKRIEDNMRSGLLAAHQFLGTDLRTLADIIFQDRLLLEPLGLTARAIAERMRYFSEQAEEGQGAKVVDGKFEVEREEHKGSILCPFADNVQASKSITRLKNLETGMSVIWSDLNIHLIEEHGFFEGHGAPFRIEPVEIAQVLEVQKEE